MTKAVFLPIEPQCEAVQGGQGGGADSLCHRAICFLFWLRRVSTTQAVYLARTERSPIELELLSGQCGLSALVLDTRSVLHATAGSRV